VLVFSWVNILIPLGIMGMDVMLKKHVPEMVSRRSSSLNRVLGLALVSAVLASIGSIIVFNVLLWWFPPNLLVPDYVVPFLQLALWTVPLTAISTVLQGAFRGMQEMRYCTLAMALYHGGYLVGLVALFVTGAMTLLNVIFLNLAVSGLTIAFEAGVLQRLYGRYKGERTQEQEVFSVRPMTSTAIQALFLALLGAVFLYVPLLIANVYRTSDLIFAGLGLALSVAAWVQQGLSAPFGVLMPRTAGDMAKQAWGTIRGYMNRAWKLGVLFSAFVAVVAVSYAAPVLIVLFAGEGMVALFFFVLMTGSFLIYPLAIMMSDTLIGIGRIRTVLGMNALWTAIVVIVLWFLAPIGHEVIVALIWLVGIPFLLIYVGLYQRWTKSRLVFGFIPRSVVVLFVVGLLAFEVVWAGMYLIVAWGLLGLVSWLFQVGLILTVIPLAIVYLWILIRSRVFDSGDCQTLLHMSEVLHPVSRPVSWLVERMTPRAVTKNKEPN
jgi:O-antigen/teichoic acid export membrane protein